MQLLQLFNPLSHLAPNILNYLFSLFYREVSGFDDLVEIADGEVAIFRSAIVPNAPDEEREDSLRILPQIFGTVENRVVVQRDSHAHLAQRLGIALQVLDGIGIGVEDIGIANQFFRSWRDTLNEIVVVSIHAGNHVLSCALRQHVHDGRLLATLQLTHPCRQENLEIAGIVLETAEHRPPEKDVVVALHVDHDAPSVVLGLQSVGRLNEFRVDVVGQVFLHWSVISLTFVT